MSSYMLHIYFFQIHIQSNNFATSLNKVKVVIRTTRKVFVYENQKRYVYFDHNRMLLQWNTVMHLVKKKKKKSELVGFDLVISYYHVQVLILMI